MTKVVGLTGGIGSGKTTVSQMLEKLGATVIDADAIVHELQAPGSPALEEIAAAFGAGLIGSDGCLDREALGAIVFRDPDARQTLNGIMHPKVGLEVARRLAAARNSSAPLVVLDIPLLFEGRSQGRAGASLLDFDATVVVYVPEEVQIERQLQREDYGRGEALRRIRSQLALEEKKGMADFVIDNAGSLEETERQVREIYTRLTAANGAG
jgi:dephospho-CoA kinase